jgi:catechol 2,3-dioxygenase-like lactoylglutathione lyase family enzyme
MKLEGIDHVAIAVPDIEKTAGWYCDVLGFERRHIGHWDGVPTFIGLGTTALALFPWSESSAAQPSKGGPMLHLAFRARRAEYDKAKEELKRRAIAFRFEDHGIAHSIYFADLNGLPLEITTYELA